MFRRVVLCRLMGVVMLHMVPGQDERGVWCICKRQRTAGQTKHE